MPASIVAFPARDASLRSLCETRAVFARARQDAEETAHRIRSSYLEVAERVADELAVMTPAELRRRFDEIDRRRGRAAAAVLFPEGDGPEVA
jgi:Mg/Co/Ni transporter MgtE